MLTAKETLAKEELLEDILSTYKPVYPSGGDWNATLDYLMAEERELMDVLRASVERSGMREPILLSDPDDPYYDEPVVLNGTHRVVLAMVSGMFTVPTIVEVESISGDPSAADEDEIVDLAEVHEDVLTIEVTGELSEEEDEDLFMALRSFELNDKQWMEAIVSNGIIGKSSTFYMEPTDVDLKELTRKVRKIIADKFAGKGLKIAVKMETDEC